MNINTDKSVYSPGDIAGLGISVLSEDGLPVCDANLKLTIKAPNGSSDILETRNLSITVNPACKNHSVSETADYHTSIPLNDIGAYTLELTAQTKTGNYSLTDRLEVKDSQKISIQRLIAHRIQTPENYPALLKISANEDFAGEIVETVPQDLTVMPGKTGLSYDRVSLDNQSINGSTESARISINNPFTGLRTQTQGFGLPETDPLLKKQYVLFGTLGHDGVDYSLPMGTPVLAADTGFVVYADWNPYGKTIILKHAWGQSYYGHLNDYAVFPNQFISKGELIGFSGSTGLSTGPHLHFGIRLNEFDELNGYYGKVDPLLYLNNTVQMSANAVKNIIWNVNMKKGETAELGYSFNAPNNPQKAYMLGPVSLSAGNEALFEENRPYQIFADALPVKMVEFVTGAVEDFTENSIKELSSSREIGAAFNQLYLAAVTAGSDFTIDGIEGLGLDWQKINTQCPGNSGLWYAIGSPAGAGLVKANLNGGVLKKGAAAISVYRYDGADPETPIGNIYCREFPGESPGLSYEIKTSHPRSLYFTVVSSNAEISPGELFTVRNRTLSGDNIGSAGLTVFDRSFGNITDGINIEAEITPVNSAELISVEILSDGNKPKNRLRHGKWFDGGGIKQPFAL